MPNLVLTNKCYNGCAFCFVDSKKDGAFLTYKKVQTLLPFIRSFDRESIHLLGGEPTLNPEFIEILKGLLLEKFKVKIFTNGKLPTKLIERLQCLHDGEFCFCVNRTNPHLAPRIVRLYRKLGYRISLSVTIFQPHQIVDHILNEIDTYRLDRQYRIGIALPIWPDRQNLYLHPKDYHLMAEELFTFIQKGVTLGIRPTFDCGFPYCFFNEEQKRYFEDNGIDFASHCGVIPDIGPDFSAMPCFPLAKLRQAVSKNSDWQELQQRFEDTLKTERYEPLFKKCRKCVEFRSGGCSGGCAALRIKST